MRNKFIFALLIMSVPMCMRGADSQSGLEKVPMLLISPQDYQVFQRQDKDKGVLLVKGKLENPASVEVRIAERQWQPVKYDPATKTFQAEIPMEAGGWFEVAVRAVEGGKTISEVTVQHVGVGEVFIVTGQSNSCNFGSARQQPSSGKVSSFDGVKWYIADDPQKGGGGTGGSFMPSFGDAMVVKYNVPVAVASCGIGSTSVRQWLPKGEKFSLPSANGKFIRQLDSGEWASTGQPYEMLMKRVNALGKNGFRAILWHQGESDTFQKKENQISGDEYSKCMETIVSALRKDAGWDVPWFTALVTYHGDSSAEDAGIRAAQKSLWDRNITFEGPDTDKLHSECRAGIHMNPKGLAAHGKLWAEKVSVQLDKILEKGAPK